ncbi:MAG: hypothetical protein JNM43_24040 [Planctomycetaceae bacterium]|nr:hypothetical protein [Planctomycetaceae bacterium]
MDKQILSSPPKVPLVFRIGIVGHRPNRLKHADHDLLCKRLSELITTVRQQVSSDYIEHRILFSDEPPAIRAISPLAEGVDRMFAREAISTGCELAVVLPFPQAELENDFQPETALEENSLDQFRGLIGKASTVFELDGCREDGARAYHHAGTVVLNQSDLLIVVWDGERQNQRGGTEETFDDAVERGVPVIWIDAHAPHHWSLVTQPIRKLEGIAYGQRAALKKSHALDELQMLVRKRLELPSDCDAGESHQAHSGYRTESPLDAILTFYSETQAGYSVAFWWMLFRDLVGDFKVKFPKWRLQPCETSLPADWQQGTHPVVTPMIARLRPYFAWSDQLADRCANAYRSAFVMAFLAAAFAVAMALTPFALSLPEHSGGEIACTVGEFLSILLILFLVFRGRRGRWHQRWLDYRLLAEIIRHQRLIAHLGGERASPRIPEHLSSYGDVGASWMAWYARGIERSLSLNRVVVDRTYLQASLQDLEAQLGGPDGQIVFHQRTASRASRIEHRLHLLEVTLLILTLTCCCQHLLQGFWPDWFHVSGRLLTFCCAFFPAVGAALAGISNQGEFRRIAQRSSSMTERLTHQLEKIRRLRELLETPKLVPKQLSPEIAAIAGETARTMVNEVLDWRIIFQDRPLKTT